MHPCPGAKADLFHIDTTSHVLVNLVGFCSPSKAIKVKLKNCINVLCVSDYYLPGYRGGGPITTLANMRAQLNGHVTLSIYTRDRDLGEGVQYPNIRVNQWFETSEGPIYYASPDRFGARGLRHALETDKFDIVYFNSFFSPHGSIFPHFALRMLSKKPPVLLAPRGEFSSGALTLKKYKKKVFLSLAHLMELYRDVFWHASTPFEAEDILRLFPAAAGRIFIAADPVPASSIQSNLFGKKKKCGLLRLVFISRISPKKNIDGLLRILSLVSVQIELDIFGPIEDVAYWNLCQEAISALPENINVRHLGPIAPEAVSSTFAQYDLFVFPTHGENFGHVIFESLRAGTPVLVSDQTPWRPDESDALTVIPLNYTPGWCEAITKAAYRTSEEQSKVICDAQSYANRYANEAGSFEDNIQMFTRVVSS